MTKKYTVASVTSTRANAESLSVRLLRYVYQTTVQIADISTDSL